MMNLQGQVQGGQGGQDLPMMTLATLDPPPHLFSTRLPVSESDRLAVSGVRSSFTSLSFLTPDMPLEVARWKWMSALVEWEPARAMRFLGSLDLWGPTWPLSRSSTACSCTWRQS